MVPFARKAFSLLKPNATMALFLEKVHGINLNGDVDEIVKDEGFSPQNSIAFSKLQKEDSQVDESSRLVEVQVWRKPL
jgi:hypothetical protein